MTIGSSVRSLGIAAAFILSIAPAARAQDPKLEIGTTMTSLTVGLGDNDITTIGVPSSGFGLLNPGVYGTVYLGPFIAVEPQLGLIWASSDGDSEHLLNFSGQVDYFLMGAGVSSPYVFASAGILDSSGSDVNPKVVGGGAGYRFTVGDSLAFRLDGRYLHFTEDGGDALVFGVSIGGVFGR